MRALKFRQIGTYFNDYWKVEKSKYQLYNNFLFTKPNMYNYALKDIGHGQDNWKVFLRPSNEGSNKKAFLANEGTCQSQGTSPTFLPCPWFGPSRILEQVGFELMGAQIDIITKVEKQSQPRRLGRDGAVQWLGMLLQTEKLEDISAEWVEMVGTKEGRKRSGKIGSIFVPKITTTISLGLRVGA